MQVNTTSLPSAAQILGPTTRAATSRADGGTVTRHVAAPVGDSAGQSVESLRSIRLAARYDRPTGRVVTRVIDESNGDHVIKGRWGLGDDDSSGGEWTAYKMKGRTPERGFARGGAGTSDEGSSESSGGEESSDSPDDIF